MTVGTPDDVSKFSTSTVHRAAGLTVTASVAELPAVTGLVTDTGFTDALTPAVPKRTSATTTKAPLRDLPTFTS
jgi:hypothetical protein